MKKLISLFTVVLFVLGVSAQLKITVPGVKWDDTYLFDRYNTFKMEFYSKKKELMRTVEYYTYYQSKGNNFNVVIMTEKHAMGIETVIDKNNQVAIKIYHDESGKPICNAGGYKMPEEKDLKKLELTPTSETKEVLGYACKKYTYTFKKIFGEVWIVEKNKTPNDLGVFRACKMAALHNTLSVDGFVMEMTTEDATGAKTLMKTVSLNNTDKYLMDFKKVEMSTAINKINYYSF